MATIYRRGPKSWRIQVHFRGARLSFSMAGNKSDAEGLGDRLSRLAKTRSRGLPIPSDLAEWLRSLDSSFRIELAERGLIDIGTAGGTLGDLATYSTQLLDESGLEKRTRTNQGQYLRSLLSFFPEERALASITQGDAEAYKRWLLSSGKVNGEGLGAASVSKRIKFARQIFGFAIQKEWLSRNPFQGVKQRVPVDSSRRAFVTAETFSKVLEAVPDREDRLVLALGRWAGLRLGSEARGLEWSSINWDRGELRIDDYKRKAVRRCPIFPELRPHLDKAFEAAEPGDRWLCPRLREKTDQAFKNRILRAIDRAGVDPWPDLLLNLRRTRATEVLGRWGLKAENEWIGHGPEVSLRHYQIVSDELFAQAAGLAGLEKAVQ